MLRVNWTRLMLSTPGRDLDRGLAGGDPIRDDGCRAQPRAAVAIDGHSRHPDSKPGLECGVARDVVAGGALRQAATDDDIFDLAGLDAGALDRLTEHVRRQGDAVGLV